MSNIKLHYLYRDGSNYKKWADIVFLNPDNLPAEVVTRGLREGFLEDGIFIAHQVRIPEVFLAAEDQAGGPGVRAADEFDLWCPVLSRSVRKGGCQQHRNDGVPRSLFRDLAEHDAP